MQHATVRKKSDRASTYKVEATAPGTTRWSKMRPDDAYAIVHPVLGTSQTWLAVEGRLQLRYTPPDDRPQKQRSGPIPPTAGQIVYQIEQIGGCFLYSAGEVRVGPLWDEGEQPADPTMQDLVNQLFECLAEKKAE